ncbi:hypothetical protein K0M31_011530 [Melipona bicolor]|uniref:Uncharacterized protein n=1 Tax=Melipona bicolor TaxID=60889 RepID=A0AA40GAJ3_9HYME|nr:hypothetical protein K0M31_011530 [Melipona bicolor]
MTVPVSRSTCDLETDVQSLGSVTLTHRHTHANTYTYTHTYTHTYIYIYTEREMKNPISACTPSDRRSLSGETRNHPSRQVATPLSMVVGIVDLKGSCDGDDDDDKVFHRGEVIRRLFFFFFLSHWREDILVRERGGEKSSAISRHRGRRGGDTHRVNARANQDGARLSRDGETWKEEGRTKERERERTCERVRERERE